MQGSRVDRKISVRRVWIVLGLLALVFGVVFLRVWQEMQIVQLGYRVNQLNEERQRLLNRQRILLSRRNALASLERVEAIAGQKLGMRVPEREQVVFLVDPSPRRSGLAGWLASGGTLARWVEAVTRGWRAHHQGSI